MEIYHFNEQVQNWGREFNVQKGEFFHRNSEFFPLTSESSRNNYVNQVTVVNKRRSKILRKCIFVAAIFVVAFFNVHLLFGNSVSFPAYDYQSWYGSEKFADSDAYYIEFIPYVVCPGDTLWDIAEKYMGNGLGYHAIAEENHLSNPDLIFPGDQLIIPVVHVKD